MSVLDVLDVVINYQSARTSDFLLYVRRVRDFAGSKLSGCDFGRFW